MDTEIEEEFYKLFYESSDNGIMCKSHRALATPIEMLRFANHISEQTRAQAIKEGHSNGYGDALKFLLENIQQLRSEGMKGKSYEEALNDLRSRIDTSTD